MRGVFFGVLSACWPIRIVGAYPERQTHECGNRHGRGRYSANGLWGRRERHEGRSVTEQFVNKGTVASVRAPPGEGVGE